MNKTVKIEGMMCPHCSGRVKTVLEALEGVDSAEVSHESGTAVLTINDAFSSEAVETAVKDAGYTFVGME